MLTELAKTVTADGDTVTLFQTDEAYGTAYGSPKPEAFDGHRRRYVFSVEGKDASGWGSVGAGADWEIPGRHYASTVDPWEPGAVAVIEPWADASTLGDADDYQPVTVRGATYEFGYSWKRRGGEWRIGTANLMRTNGTITQAGHDRVQHILTAARDLFLSLPNAERETVRRALRDARDRQRKIRNDAEHRQTVLTRAIAAL